MTQKLKISTILICGMAVVVAACGQRGDDSSSLPTSPSQPGYGAPQDPFNNPQYPTPGTAPASGTATPRPVPSVPAATGSAIPSTTPVPGVTPSATPSGNPSPSPSGTPRPFPTDFNLRITDVKKKTSGIWVWKKAEIMVQLQNPLMTRAQSGRLQITYFLEGSVVGEPVRTSVSLQAGDIKSFTFKATRRSDDSNAQIMADDRP